ncbi:hypothetical protein PUR28_15415 [Streptomyces sp. BE308]|uniref:hypothetical protein n=1 Tax=Streptomyces sp. BE308 TaxID=3002529 RepID=UPI002E772A6C|nr:hypothetical protein [Streptomyces sp. BE308]MEE1792146.1 hypothetical protein [Streptomyces sp. BE308]
MTFPHLASLNPADPSSVHRRRNNGPHGNAGLTCFHAAVRRAVHHHPTNPIKTTFTEKEQWELAPLYQSSGPFQGPKGQDQQIDTADAHLCVINGCSG